MIINNDDLINNIINNNILIDDVYNWLFNKKVLMFLNINDVIIIMISDGNVNRYNVGIKLAALYPPFEWFTVLTNQNETKENIVDVKYSKSL